MTRRSEQRRKAASKVINDRSLPMHLRQMTWDRENSKVIRVAIAMLIPFFAVNLWLMGLGMVTTFSEWTSKKEWNFDGLLYIMAAIVFTFLASAPMKAVIRSVSWFLPDERPSAKQDAKRPIPEVPDIPVNFSKTSKNSKNDELINESYIAEMNGWKFAVTVNQLNKKTLWPRRPYVSYGFSIISGQPTNYLKSWGSMDHLGDEELEEENLFQTIKQWLNYEALDHPEFQSQPKELVNV